MLRLIATPYYLRKRGEWKITKNDVLYESVEFILETKLKVFADRRFTGPFMA